MALSRFHMQLCQVARKKKEKSQPKMLGLPTFRNRWYIVWFICPIEHSKLSFTYLLLFPLHCFLTSLSIFYYYYYSKKNIVYRINTIPQVAEANRGGKWRLINYITCKHFPRKKEERKRRKMMLQRRKFCFKTIFIGTRINK